MSNATAEEGEVVSQDEAEALASAMAGYNSRGTTPPDEVPDTPSANPEDTPAIVAEAAPEAVVTDPPAQTLAAQLAELKAQVKEHTAVLDPAAVRRMHGEIGEINRRLKQVEPAPVPTQAPVDDELTAALKGVDSLAEEYPELAGPLATALKVIAAKPTAAPVDPSATQAEIAAAVQKQRQADAMEALTEEHPDYTTVRDTPAFKAWEATKPREYQERLRTTWNPAVVSKGLSEFKASQASQQQQRQTKQTRLAAAITPQGVPAKAGPSTLPDEAGFAIGYGKAHKRL